MRHYRMGFVLVIAAFAVLAPGSSEAQDNKTRKNPFTWGTFGPGNTSDNQVHSYPRWGDIQGMPGKVNFDIGQGSTAEVQGWTAIKAVARVYKPSALVPGGYETTPFLTMETTLIQTVVGVSTMTWSDTGDPKKVFDSGITVKVVITITYRNNADPTITQDVEMPAFYVDTTAF